MNSNFELLEEFGIRPKERKENINFVISSELKKKIDDIVPKRQRSLFLEAVVRKEFKRMEKIEE